MAGIYIIEGAAWIRSRRARANNQQTTSNGKQATENRQQATENGRLWGSCFRFLFFVNCFLLTVFCRLFYPAAQEATDFGDQAAGVFVLPHGEPAPLVGQA